MADSFFGFNTTLSAMDEGSCLSDDEYDLLNEETFGLEASQCDWEDQHETFAKITESNKKSKDDDLDLEASLSNLVLDDCVVPAPSDLDDTSVDLDPKVWASPDKPITQSQNQIPRTLCTVEEIERSLLRPPINQNQAIPQQNGILHNPPPAVMVRHFPPMQLQNQRCPPGLPRHPPTHVPPPQMRMMPPNVHPQFSHTHPANLLYNTNLNMSPMFNRQDLSQTFPPCALNQHPMHQQKHQQNFIPNNPIQNQTISNHSMTNRNMVHMIQQNHPLLQNYRNQQYNRLYNNQINQSANFNSIHKNLMTNQNNQQQHSYNGQFNAHLTNGGEVLDEYSNLMSARDKQWLINIQMMQLNTGTPYIDDYYYTVFKEKQNKRNGERETVAHKDNTLNHPLIQPKQPNNRFFSNSNNNNQNRERRNSQSRDKENSQQQRTYTPLQFENSLGKLTCGSVTAPRKIIDMEMVSTDKDSTNIISSEAKKCRQLLMMIESLYRTLLKLEDLSNPLAVATSKLVREREEKQLQLLADQKSKDQDSTTSIETTLILTKPENKNDLISILLTALDKISILNVRKGKILLLRILPHLDIDTHHSELLDFYCRLIRNLPQLGRKDQNSDNLLPKFYEYFKTFMSNFELEHFFSISDSFMDIGEKGMAYCISNKLGMSILSLLLLSFEEFCKDGMKNITNSTSTIPQSWATFLVTLGNALSILGGPLQSPLEYIDRDILYQHLKKCPQLKADSAKLALFERTFVCIEQREN